MIFSSYKFPASKIEDAYEKALPAIKSLREHDSGIKEIKAPRLFDIVRTDICAVGECDGSGLVEVACQYGQHFIKCLCKSN